MTQSLLPLIVLISGLLLTQERASGQEPFPEPPPTVKTYEWTVSPSAEPAPALKHRFSTDLIETVPGNAAIHYIRATLMLPRITSDQAQKEIDWYERRSDQLPLDDVKPWLAQREIVFQEIAAATRCESCDWGIRFQDLRGRDVIEVRLMEFQEMRQLARLLRIKAQVEIVERRFDDAISTLRMSHRLAQNVGRAPSVIVSLISTAITAVTNDVTGELIAAADSPNVYWALRLIPDPTIDRQTVARIDVNMLFQLFPFLKDADTANHTPDEWQRLLMEAIHDVRQMTDDRPSGKSMDAINQLSATVLILRSYPVAKRHLIARGMNPAKVESMPVGQVVAIYSRDCFRHVTDEFMKWASLPYYEGEARLRQLNSELQRDGYLGASQASIAERDPLLFNQHLLPSYLTGEAYMRQRRMIALLSTVEAIRMHAAANQGVFPKTLAEITRVPVPLDPARMKPFLYRPVGDQVEILAPQTREPGDEYSGRRILLRLR